MTAPGVYFCTRRAVDFSIGPELFPAIGSSWSVVGDGWTIGEDSFTFENPDPSSGYLQFDTGLTLEVGETYRLSYVVVNVNESQEVKFTEFLTLNVESEGSFSFDFVCTSDIAGAVKSFSCDNGVSVELSNLSLKLITPVARLGFAVSGGSI